MGRSQRTPARTSRTEEKKAAICIHQTDLLGAKKILKFAKERPLLAMLVNGDAKPCNNATCLAC